MKNINRFYLFIILIFSCISLKGNPNKQDTINSLYSTIVLEIPDGLLYKKTTENYSEGRFHVYNFQDQSYIMIIDGALLKLEIDSILSINNIKDKPSYIGSKNNKHYRKDIISDIIFYYANVSDKHKPAFDEIFNNIIIHKKQNSSSHSNGYGILIPYDRLVKRDVIYVDSCEINVVHSEDNSIEYISCNDSSFCVEGIRPGAKFPDKLKGKELEYLRGWGYYVNITGNWYAGFDYNIEPTDTSKVLFVFWFNFNSKHAIKRMSTHEKDRILERYYNKTFVIADNDETFDLLMLLTSSFTNENEVNNAINIFCEICKNADGALAEALGIYAIIMIENYPNQMISKITEDKELQSQYIHYIATHFYYNHTTAGASAVDDFFKKIGNALDSQTKINTLSNLKPRVKELLITISD